MIAQIEFIFRIMNFSLFFLVVQKRILIKNNTILDVQAKVLLFYNI
jgi:hypothetical protein